MDLFASLDLDSAERQSGDAVLVFPTGEIDFSAFLRFASLVRKLPSNVLLVRPKVELVPHVAAAARARVQQVGPGVHVVDVCFGYDDEPHVPDAIALEPGLVDAARARYYVFDDRRVAIPLRGMARWRALLFRMLSAASVPPAEWLHLPPERTVAIGAFDSQQGAAPQKLDQEFTPPLPAREHRA